jgi:hypothetical protein
MIVRALAVRQPFAGLIANGTKRTEYRTWSTPYRGAILIIASRGRNRERTEEARQLGQLTDTDNAKGATLCVVDLVDVVWDDAEDCYAWKLARPRAVPVRPVKGKLNLYRETVPDGWRARFGADARKLGDVADPPRSASRQRRSSRAPNKPRAAYVVALAAWNAAGRPDGPLRHAMLTARWEAQRGGGT